MLYAIALLVTALSGESPRLPKPWTLMVGIEQTGLITWVSVDYATPEECVEGMTLIALATPVRGRVVDMYCERKMNVA